MSNNLLTLLGFACKAGKLSFGMEACITSIKRNKARLVLTACDLSAKSKKEIDFNCSKYGAVPYHLETVDIKTLSAAVGRKCGIISVNDSGFSNVILSQKTGMA